MAGYNSACFFIHSSEVSECHTSDYDGGSIYTEYAPNEAVTGSCSADAIIQTQFDGVGFDELNISGCTTDSDRGGLYILSPPQGFPLRHCDIVGSSSVSGGAIYLRIDDEFIKRHQEPSEDLTIFYFLYFENNTARLRQGHDLYYVFSTDQTASDPFSFSSPIQSAFAQTCCVSNRGETHPEYDVTSGSIKVDDLWLPNGMFVNSESTNTSGCGYYWNRTMACDTIGTGIGQARYQQKGFSIILVSGIHSIIPSKGVVTNESQRFILRGEEMGVSQAEAIVNVGRLCANGVVLTPISWSESWLRNIQIEISQNDASAGCFDGILFKLSGTLSLELVKVYTRTTTTLHKSNIETPCSKSLIQFDDGSLFIGGYLFSDISISSTPLFGLQAPSFPSNSSLSTFTSIVRNEGNGSILSTADDFCGSVALFNTNFDSCVVTNTNGQGRALWVSLDYFKHFSLPNCSFTNCSVGRNDESQAEGKGGAVYLQLIRFDFFTFSDLKF